LQHLKVYNVYLDTNLSGGNYNCRVSSSGLLSTRLFNSPLPNGDIIVGWTDANLNGHASYLKKDATKGYELKRTITIPYKRVRGLAALNDSSVGILLWNYTTPFNNTKMWIQKWSAMNGASEPTMVFSTELRCGSYPSDFSIGDSRMIVDANGDFYAYYHVHSTDGHEGDAYFRCNSQTGEPKTIWGWGCSHSMSNLLSYHPNLNNTLSLCITDCYPGTSGDFENNSIGGLFTEDRNRLHRISAGCNGCVGGEIGMVAPVYNGGWVVIFNSHSQFLDVGQANCRLAKYSQDVALAFITKQKTLQGDVIWLTDSDENDYDPGLARYGAFCAGEKCKEFGQDDELFMVGWKSSRGRFIGWMNNTGQIISGPFDVTKVELNGVKTSVSWGSRDDTWRTLQDGSVSWLEAPGTPRNLLRVFVMEYGEIPLNPASSVTPCGMILIAIIISFALIFF